MKKIYLPFLLFCLLITSCSEEPVDTPPEESAKEKDGLITKGFSFQGEFSETTSPLKQTSSEDLFNIQVFEESTGLPYAMVLGDDLSKIRIDFEPEKQYHLMVSYIKDGKNAVRLRDDLGWELPFTPSAASATPLNQVRYTVEEEFHFIADPSISTETGIFETYVPVDRFFGELKEFSAVEDGSALTVQLKRMVFGLEMDIALEKVPEVDQVLVTITPKVDHANTPRTFEVSLEEGEGNLHIPFLTLETSEGQGGDLRETLTAGYIEEMPLSIGTPEEPNRFFEGYTPVKRMVMHHIDFQWENTNNISFTLEEEEMGTEELEMSLDPNERVATLTLEADTRQVIANGSSKSNLVIMAFDEQGHEVQGADYQLEVNGLPYYEEDFQTTEPGTYNLSVRVGNMRSNEIQIEAVGPVGYEEINLPVVFHVVHFGDQVGTGNNLSNAQVQKVFEKLNRGFANNYGSENPNAIDTRIRFRMATKDPQGNSLEEPGINRINASAYDVGSTAQMRRVDRPWPIPTKKANKVTAMAPSGDHAYDQRLGQDEAYEMSQETSWDMKDYLNIYILPIQTDLYLWGYAYLPVTYSAHPLDGLSTYPQSYEHLLDLKYEQCVIDTEAALLEDNKTVIHEVGHNLGLHHTFSTDSCRTSDYCSDTYSYVKDYSGISCDDNRGLEVHDNHMDYVGSRKTFTYQQGERMRHVLDYGFYYSDLKESQK